MAAWDNSTRWSPGSQRMNGVTRGRRGGHRLKSPQEGLPREVGTGLHLKGWAYESWMNRTVKRKGEEHTRYIQRQWNPVTPEPQVQQVANAHQLHSCSSLLPCLASAHVRLTILLVPVLLYTSRLHLPVDLSLFTSPFVFSSVTHSVLSYCKKKEEEEESCVL